MLELQGSRCRRGTLVLQALHAKKIVKQNLSKCAEDKAHETKFAADKMF